MPIRESIYHYCNYQLRSHQEVRNKLYELGCNTVKVEQYIAELIEKGLLNEEQFAKAIARGKFRMKQWGRKKIIQQLKQHRVSEYCIKVALKEIDAEEYDATLRKLAEKKWKEISGGRKELRKYKVTRYLLQKGFESDLVSDLLNEIIKAETEVRNKK